ncbi:esterase [[Mycobacterium] wendilense]|uniref:RsiV family protein n=1 Tax=[Mycobacterium] wendilense TaxID=3064284 RepID=A0ABN9P512_9MYCO|nr:esterase [Mycolicibacterium sp. MU0050]CAJ1584170.1 RsiV family protein [Mycolicibacterium sp. MU0050]
MRNRSVATAAAVLTLGALLSAGSAAAAAPTCADLDATQVEQVCQILRSDPGYRVDLSFPATYPDAEALHDYVRQTRDGFLNVAQTPDARSRPYALEMRAREYGAAVGPRDTRSVVLETYEDVGGPRAATFYKTFTWDNGLREPVTIDTLFRPDVEPFPVLRALVQGEVSKQFGAAEPIPAGAGLDPRAYQNFALTDDALIFFFDRGALLAETAGVFEVSLPRTAVGPLLA